MIVGIDATNIRLGGGLTHLKEILENYDFQQPTSVEIVVWSNKRTLDALPINSLVKKNHHFLLNYGVIGAYLFQIFYLTRKARSAGCRTLLVPGSTFLGRFQPFVAISQNLLPFEKSELRRYNSMCSKFKFLVLYQLQKYSFKRASGVIFLSEYARETIQTRIGGIKGKSIVIPHGINHRFKAANGSNIHKTNRKDKTLNILYVSQIAPYKHQDKVVEAVINLSKKGFNLRLTLIGSGDLDVFPNLMDLVIQNTDIISFLGPVDYDKLELYYRGMDLFVFASTCENLPITLIEAMSTGIPILSTNKRPMTDVLGDGAIYFDPTDLETLERALKEAIENPFLLDHISLLSERKSDFYSWKECSNKTFDFLINLT